MTLLFFVVMLGAGLFCIGGFLWSIVEERPKAIWLLGAAMAIVVAVTGLVITRS